jgi:hypothetical protein
MQCLYTKIISSCKFVDFLIKFTYYYINSMVIQQIITIIAKIGQKILQIETTTYFGSINIA